MTSRPTPVAWVIVGVLCLALAPAHPQTSTNQSEPSQPNSPAQLESSGNTTPTTEPSVSAAREGRVLLPDMSVLKDGTSLAPRTDLPAEVVQKIRRFELFREQYLRERTELLKLYRGATDEERARLRDRFRLLYEEWQRRALEFRQQARDRQRELQDKLPTHRESLRDALRESRDQAVQKIQEERKRIGDE